MSITRVLIGVSAVVGTLSLTSCETSKALTGLGPHLAPSTLTLNLFAPPAAGHFSLGSGTNVYQCQFAITASTSGGLPLEHVVWNYGLLTFSRSSDGLQTSITVTSGDYATLFGVTEMARGQAAVSGAYSVSSTGPFNGSLVTYYSAGGAFPGISLRDEKAVTTPLVCN